MIAVKLSATCKPLAGKCCDEMSGVLLPLGLKAEGCQLGYVLSFPVEGFASGSNGVDDDTPSTFPIGWVEVVIDTR